MFEDCSQSVFVLFAILGAAVGALRPGRFLLLIRTVVSTLGKSNLNNQFIVLLRYVGRVSTSVDTRPTCSHAGMGEVGNYSGDFQPVIVAL